MGSVYFKIRVNGYARTAAVTVEFEDSTYTVAESDDSETTDVTENEVVGDRHAERGPRA